MAGHEGEEGTWVIDFDLDGNEIGGHWVAASSMSMSGGSESTSSTSESYSEEVMSQESYDESSQTIVSGGGDYSIMNRTVVTETGMTNRG